MTKTSASRLSPKKVNAVAAAKKLTDSTIAKPRTKPATTATASAAVSVKARTRRFLDGISEALRLSGSSWTIEVLLDRKPELLPHFIASETNADGSVAAFGGRVFFSTKGTKTVQLSDQWNLAKGCRPGIVQACVISKEPFDGESYWVVGQKSQLSSTRMEPGKPQERLRNEYARDYLACARKIAELGDRPANLKTRGEILAMTMKPDLSKEEKKAKFGTNIIKEDFAHAHLIVLLSNTVGAYRYLPTSFTQAHADGYIKSEVSTRVLPIQLKSCVAKPTRAVVARKNDFDLPEDITGLAFGFHHIKRYPNMLFVMRPMLDGDKDCRLPSNGSSWEDLYESPRYKQCGVSVIATSNKLGDTCEISNAGCSGKRGKYSTWNRNIVTDDELPRVVSSLVDAKLSGAATYTLPRGGVIDLTDWEFIEEEVVNLVDRKSPPRPKFRHTV